jgi:hypothetical protein
MFKFALLIAVFLLGVEGDAEAQNTTQPFSAQQPSTQSLRPTESACSAGSQSVRVCNSDFTSCNSICAATALDPSADVAGCGTRCCNQFNTCLRLRGCGANTVDCF